MEREDEYLDIRPFTIKSWKPTAILQKRDYSTAFNAPDLANQDNFPTLSAPSNSPSDHTAPSQKQDNSPKALHWRHPPATHTSTPQATEAKAPRTIPPECKSGFCPVIKIHTAKPFKRDDWDLPEMIQHFQTHIDNLSTQKKRPPTHLVTLLDRFYTIHGTVGDFDVPAKPGTSVGEGKKEVSEGEVADREIITVRRLYPYKGVPDAEKLPLRPERKAGDVKNDTTRTTVAKGGRKDVMQGSAANNDNDKGSNDRPASRAAVTQEALRLVFARLPSGR